MADAPAEKQPKRRLRNVETVRERAERAQVDAARPSRRTLFKNTAASTAARPGRGLAKFFNRQPFRFIGKALRFFGRIIFPRYFRNSWRELRLVTWPNRRQTRQLTFAVLLFAIVFGAVVALVDYGLDKLFKQVLLK